jgi:hypothetical protein
MTKLAAGVTFGLSLLGAGVANAQNMTFASADIKVGGTLPMSRCSRGSAAPAATFRRL